LSDETPIDGSGDNDGIEPVSILEEMQRSYLDYAMSVIVSRALPDVRDGLKPVHRRILYAMHEAGYIGTSKYGNRPASSATSWVSTTRMATSGL
jgi:DNA gyrase subunit A